jgi:hypothetical protein
MSLAYLRLNQATVLSSIFCRWRIFLQSILLSIGLWTMAMISFERYLLIFYSNALEKYKILFFYLPLAWCFLQPISLLIFLTFSPPCTNRFHFFNFLCAGPCYYYLNMWNVFAGQLNITIPIFVFVLTNIVVITCVLYQKRHMQSNQYM